MKATQVLSRALRRLALTTKQVNGGYYKGTGSGSVGRHTKHGGYLVEWHKVRTYRVPEGLKDFKVYLDSYDLEEADMLAHTFRDEEDGTIEGLIPRQSQGRIQWRILLEPMEEREWS